MTLDFTSKGEYSFEKDLAKGQQGEEIISRFLSDTFGFRPISSNQDKTHDLLMEYSGRQVSFEVKTDFFQDTGNIVVEYFSRGKPSGISVTSADYFVNYFLKLGELWIIKPDALKRLLKDPNQKGITRRENVGDKNSGTHLFLMKKEKVREFFTVYSVSAEKFQ